MRRLFVEDAEVVEEEPEPVTTSGSWTSDWNLFGTSPESSAPAPKSGGSSRVALPVGDDGIEDAEVVEESADDILVGRSEEHTSALQSRFDLVCRLLLEKKD